MATKQKFSNETIFVETTVVADSENPPTSGAVYTAIGGVTAEIPEVESAVTENSTKVPTSGAVYTAIGSARTTIESEIPTEATIKAYIYDTIYMSANDKTYAVTIDAQGALAVAEVVEEAES